MAILKCKMCGGDLSITADEKIVECEFCGTTQTIPDGNDEKKTNLFNRANRLRIANEFDKASGIYESIIAEFPDEAESYWGLCLCKFGIEYVDDPKTAKKIPTCHRTSFESIFDDENYKMAIEKSDVIAQGVYKEEATVIDNLQKDILSIVHKEEPFDVFICYKETDELGQRTQDSVLAQDIYDALTDKGFKVFFSRITLEDKLGKQYEPYIFAALNSAKVMLAIGTKEEYYNAVWVKNEWSRYLVLMESDKSKMLIPCYRDIDPYDMPQEFKNLQGLDMGKLGFLQDLVRGITKIINPEQGKQVQAETTVSTTANATTDSLLKRAFMFLEDGNWQSANEYCEKVLDINPECAEAYLGKLMADIRVRKQSELVNVKNSFESNRNYQKVIRFGSKQLKTELAEYIETINVRNAEKFAQENYSEATILIEKNTIDSHRKAINCLQQIADYKDAGELIEKSKKRIEEIKEEEKQYAEIGRKNREYDRAVKLMKGENSNNYAQAMRIFQSLSGWKDSEDKKAECDKIIRELVAKEKELKAEKERKEELARQQAEESARKTKLVLKIATPIFIVGIIFVVILTSVIIPNNKYNEAIKLMDAGEYKTAIARFEKLNGHKDSEEKAEKIKNVLMPTKELTELCGEAFVEKYVENGKITFGSYEQDNNTSNGKEKITWKFLEKKENRIYVISEYVLDYQDYNEYDKSTEDEYVNWFDCSLRKWLNNDFYNEAFTPSEKERIVTINWKDGNGEVDNVVLLSNSEVEELLPSTQSRTCTPTTYASEVSVFAPEPDENVEWWLRTKEGYTSNAFMIEDYGVCSTRYECNSAGVRPALWISLNEN